MCVCVCVCGRGVGGECGNSLHDTTIMKKKYENNRFYGLYLRTSGAWYRGKTPGSRHDVADKAPRSSSKKKLAGTTLPIGKKNDFDSSWYSSIVTTPPHGVLFVSCVSSFTPRIFRPLYLLRLSNSKTKIRTQTATIAKKAKHKLTIPSAIAG